MIIENRGMKEFSFSYDMENDDLFVYLKGKK